MADSVERALEVLLSDALADVVDVALVRREGHVEAHARDGMVGFTRDGVVHARGTNPLARQDPSTFSPLAEESANVRPDRARNVYPFAYDNAAQLFEHPSAPDIAVVKTPAHNWEDRGGHRGEHGSLDLVQSRAPLIVAGAGVKQLGRIDAAARMIDVAPTICALAGVEPDGANYLRAQDGAARTEVIDHAAARVVAFLCDGSNANVLYDMAATGELPNIARLMQMGTTFGHGLIASFPSVTLANHTTAITGVHPGRHGILHNYFYDRARARQVKTNEPDTWHTAREEISPDVETIFEAIARSGGGFTAAVDEPADRGAGYATFDLVRAAGPGALAGALSAEDVPGATKEFVQRKREYGWASSADNLAVQQVQQVWAGALGNARPRFLWINLILPDAANHAGGPYSDIGHAGMRDTDARIGQIMDALDWGGNDTAFVLLADHGMEESDPACTGDFDAELARAGIEFRDEGYGFLYL